MRKFMYFITADAQNLERRLERLGRKGWELTDLEGLFTGDFTPTKRTDLEYLVLPFGSLRKFQGYGGYEGLGWELMGSFNGMAIFKSLPCVKPDRQLARSKMEQEGALRPDRLSIPLLLLILLLLTGALFLAPQWLQLERWYLSYQGMGIAALKWWVLALAAVNLLTLGQYIGAWIRGLTPWALAGGCMAFFLLSMLDETGQTVFFVGVLVLLIGACLLSFWPKNRVLAGCLGGVCLAVLCLGLLFPNVDRTESSGVTLRALAVSPRATLTDCGIQEQPSLITYQREGTFLVRSSVYTELSGAGNVTTQVEQCLTEQLARQVLQQRLNQGSWEVTEQGWISPNGRRLLVCSGRRVVQLTLSSDAPEIDLAALYQSITEG